MQRSRSRRRGRRSNNNEYIWRKTRNRTLNEDGATLEEREGAREAEGEGEWGKNIINKITQRNKIKKRR